MVAHRKPTPTFRRLGFTMVEVLVVLALLVTASAVILPSVSNWQSRMPLDQAVGILQVELAATRLHAIDDAETWCVDVSADRRSLVRFRMNGDRSIDAEHITLPEGVTIESKAETSSEQPLIRFLSDGTTIGATLVIVDENGAQQSLAVDRLTGATVVR